MYITRCGLVTAWRHTFWSSSARGQSLVTKSTRVMFIPLSSSPSGFDLTSPSGLERAAEVSRGLFVPGAEEGRFAARAKEDGNRREPWLPVRATCAPTSSTARAKAGSGDIAPFTLGTTLASL